MLNMLISLGLDAHATSLTLVDNLLYTENIIESFTIPSSVQELCKQALAIIGQLFDVKVGKKDQKRLNLILIYFEF
jgi:hypothetical protein